MSTNNTDTRICPQNAVPEPNGIGIDSKSVFVVVPRGNYTGDSADDWMVTCCEPSPVQLAGNDMAGTCWQWCDLPSKYTNLTSKESLLLSDFTRCVTATARATNSSYRPSAVLLSAAPRDGVVLDGLLGLAVVLAVAAGRLFM